MERIGVRPLCRRQLRRRRSVGRVQFAWRFREFCDRVRGVKNGSSSTVRARLHDGLIDQIGIYNHALGARRGRCPLRGRRRARGKRCRAAGVRCSCSVAIGTSPTVSTLAPRQRLSGSIGDPTESSPVWCEVVYGCKELVDGFIGPDVKSVKHVAADNKDAALAAAGVGARVRRAVVPAAVVSPSHQQQVRHGQDQRQSVEAMPQADLNAAQRRAVAAVLLIAEQLLNGRRLAVQLAQRRG